MKLAKRISRWDQIGFTRMVLTLLLIFFLAACATSISRAKFHLAQAQVRERSFQTVEAAALYKKSLAEAERSVRTKPSSQAYLLKGMAEVKLARWSEASRSFSLAATLGEDKANLWAREVSLYGLALSLEEQGLVTPALRLYSSLSERGKFSPVVQAALGRLVDHQLALLAEAPEKEREKILSKNIEIVGKALESDQACGYYHYLMAQLLGHQKKYVQSFEEAVMARELGLPKLEIQRDNDNQITFCYRQLKGSLTGQDWSQFAQTYRLWIKKWNWPDEETPDWRRR
ncbi:MAG: hypothetical protein H5U05_11525 [Candidatus Aminicenantes bacterium]|nr:hypothetical protein [Candidatus Aminicenantes bacterium]